MYEVIGYIYQAIRGYGNKVSMQNVLFVSKDEKIGRGLDHRDGSFAFKVERHFPLWRGVEDAYVNDILSFFEELFME